MAISAPSWRQAAHFCAVPAVTITRASKALPSRIAVVPMPLAPPCTSSVSPCRGRAHVLRITATRHERTHPLPECGLPHALAEKHHFARDLEAGNVGDAGWR